MLWLPKVVHMYRPESVSSTDSISSWPLRIRVCSPSTTATWSLVQLTAWRQSLAEQLRSRRSPMERVYSSACVSTDTTEEWRKFYLAAIQHCDFMLSVIQSYRFMNRGEKREKQIKLSPETPKTNQKQWFISIGEKKKRKKKRTISVL